VPDLPDGSPSDSTERRTPNADHSGCPRWA
jgi:hypothetical protein